MQPINGSPLESLFQLFKFFKKHLFDLDIELRSRDRHSISRSNIKFRSQDRITWLRIRDQRNNRTHYPGFSIVRLHSNSCFLVVWHTDNIALIN